MVKKAYQKLCFYPLARVAVFGILLSALLYQFHGLLSAGDELVARVLGWLCLGSGALHGSLLAVGVIRYVIQVQWASCRLRSLPGYVRERLDQELQTGDRINDLYFTSDFLLVYQLQVRSKQGFACIPYPEIGRKILSLKSRMQTVRDTAGEQSRRDRRRQAGAEKDSERPSRLLLQPRRGPGRPGLHRYGGAFPGEGGAAGSAPTPGGRLWRAPVLCGDVWRHSGDGHWRCPAGPGFVVSGCLWQTGAPRQGTGRNGKRKISQEMIE